MRINLPEVNFALRRVALLVILSCAMILPIASEAQSADVEEDFPRPTIPILFKLLLPEGLRTGYEMRAYIAGLSDTGRKPALIERAKLDELYHAALTWTHGNTEAAALGCAFGMFEHESLTIRILGVELTLPLTSETHERFEQRSANLPTYVYSDDSFDRDKPQHFFSSAWLKQALGMDWLAALLGEFVEAGEASFVVGGASDPRDVNANEDGRHFGTDASGSLDALPSHYLVPPSKLGEPASN